jgi:hypothetical protein
MNQKRMEEGRMRWNTFLDVKSFAEEGRNAIRHHTSSLAPHDRALLQQVVGMGGTEEGFLYGGFTVSTGLRAALRSLGTSTTYRSRSSSITRQRRHFPSMTSLLI